MIIRRHSYSPYSKMKLFALLFLASIYFRSCAGKADWQPGLKTFSHARKEGYCTKGNEIELFQRSGGPGVVTEQWFTSEQCFGPDTIVRYYIDGDVNATIEMNLYFGHGIGYVSQTGTYPYKDYGRNGMPWGTRRIGRLAYAGGLYNTIRIPFQKSIRVTFETTGQGSYWYILRGAENYPIVVGDLVLPKNAVLKLYKHENTIIHPKEYIVLASTANYSGLLYQVTLGAASANFQYLEACFRALIDDDEKFQFLSSGTEDFFLSAFYYNKGTYHTDHAGLTYKKNPGTMTAYKFFEDDPVAFSKSFKLVWRCGEAMDNECYKISNQNCFTDGNFKYCKDTNGKSVPITLTSPLVTKMTSYVWTYEWPTP